MNYYQACHWRDAGEAPKQRLALDAGLALDPANPDLLIAAFNLPKADPVFRNRVRALIKKLIFQMRMRVVAGSDRASACNELAWLIANTEGDLDEAIERSRKSLRDQPDSGAYYDTLARCYFAKGDYEKAVKYQIKAIELEPNRGLIAKQLELFRRTYEQKLGKPAPKPGPPKKRNQGLQLLGSPGLPSVELEGLVPDQ
jgi:tetratricopeptide (TPR) repeat protein